MKGFFGAQILGLTKKEKVEIGTKLKFEYQHEKDGEGGAALEGWEGGGAKINFQ